MLKLQLIHRGAMFLALSASMLFASEQHLADFHRVVTSDKPNDVERVAAKELADFVGRIVSHSLDVIPLSKWSPDDAGLSFFVGTQAAERAADEKLAPWKVEESLLRTVPRGLLLAGDDGPGDAWSSKTHAGSMLAVYTLLDDYLGVHWFWPGPFGAHVPDRPDATIPEMNLRSCPAFEIRSIGLGYFAYHTKAFGESARKWERRNRLGWVRSAVFGHSWEAAFDLRSGKTFKEHPEWFALVNGKRQPPQMCTTNPEVIARMVEYVLKSKTDIVNISPSDGGGFCECERCRALDVPGLLAYDNKHVQLSDRIFTYANEIARRVHAANPNKGVGMFAYTYYNRPPVKIQKMEENLYLSFVYQCAAQRNPDELAQWRQTVAGWQKLGAKMVVREGWGNHYYFGLPMLHYDQIIANLSEAHRLGFIAAYGDGSKNFATQAPNDWALTRMMWNPDRDAVKVMPEFYRSAYGPAAAAMQAYFECYNHALDGNWSKLDKNVDSTAIAYANIIGAWRRLIPQATVDEAERHLKDAARLAPSGEYADRIAFHRFGQDYTRLMLDLLETYRVLAHGGLKLDVFSSIDKSGVEDAAQRDTLLHRAYELGEQREQMLLAHRDWAGPDEGLYAFTNDAKIRQWHTEVKAALKIERPTALTKRDLEKSGRNEPLPKIQAPQ